jgi:hypothetical protein
VHGGGCDDLAAVAAHVEAGAEAGAGVVAHGAPVGRVAVQEVHAAGAGEVGERVGQRLVGLLEGAVGLVVVDVEGAHA